MPVDTGARVRSPATSSPTLGEVVESSLAEQWDTDKRYGKPPSPISKTRIPQPAEPSKAKQLLQQAVHRYVHPERQIVLPRGLDTRNNPHRASDALKRGHKQPWNMQQQPAYHNRLAVLREGLEAEGELSQVSSFLPFNNHLKRSRKACAGDSAQHIQLNNAYLHAFRHAGFEDLRSGGLTRL